MAHTKITTLGTSMANQGMSIFGKLGGPIHNHTQKVYTNWMDLVLVHVGPSMACILG